MSQYPSTLTPNFALSRFNCVLRRSKSEADLIHARLSPAIVATSQTAIHYSDGIRELFIPGRVHQSTQTYWGTQDNTTEHPIPTTTTRAIETQTAIPERSSREVQTDAERQKTKVDQGTETDSIPTTTSIPRGIQVDIQKATTERETQTAVPTKLADRHVQTDVSMRKATVEQEAKTENVGHARISDQAIQTDFDIAETKVEQGIQTESLRTQTFPRSMQTVDTQKATAEQETQTAMPAKLSNRYVQTVSMQKATAERETQTATAARLSDQKVQTGIQTSSIPTRNTVSISKGIQTFRSTAEQETQTDLRTETEEVTRQPGTDNAVPVDRVVDREVEKISQLELHPQFDFERPYKGVVFLSLFTVSVIVFTIYYGYNAGVSRDPFVHLFWSSSDGTIVIIVALSQLSIILLNGLLSTACQSLRWSRASSPRGTNLLSFLVLSPFTSTRTLLVLLWFRLRLKTEHKRMSLSAFDHSVVGLALQR